MGLARGEREPTEGEGARLEPAPLPGWATVGRAGSRPLHPVGGGADGVGVPGVPREADKVPQPVEAVLGRDTSGVRLATDGEGRWVLRFEVDSGELRGTRVSVSSLDGAISATLVAPGPIAAVALEHALEGNRASLEGRGIDVADLQVQPDGSGSRGEHGRGGEAPSRRAPGERARDGGRPEPCAGPSVDYFV